jgi:periplasmic protein CpxP/Spy
MKKWMIGAMLLMMASLGVTAQQYRGGQNLTPEKIATKRTERMATELQLNEEQKKQIHEINLESAKKREAEHKAKQVEMEARKEEFNSQKLKIESVLTEEQKTKWNELNSRKHDHRGRGQGREGHERGHSNRPSLGSDKS